MHRKVGKRMSIFGFFMLGITTGTNGGDRQRKVNELYNFKVCRQGVRSTRDYPGLNGCDDSGAWSYIA